MTLIVAFKPREGDGYGKFGHPVSIYDRDAERPHEAVDDPEEKIESAMRHLPKPALAHERIDGEAWVRYEYDSLVDPDAHDRRIVRVPPWFEHDAQGSGEPWWVVVAEVPGEDPGSVGTTVDAPTRELAGAEAERELIGERGEDVEKITRLTGPYPKEVRTADREMRPNQCHGCGLDLYCGNHPPMPQQTWFEAIVEESDDDGVAWECICCETLTRLPRPDTEDPLIGGDTPR